MSEKQIHAVTGAYGYSGKYIARRLLDRGHTVITLTNSPQRANPFGGRVPAHGFHFDQPDRLTALLRGVTVLYNTYWVRFNHKLFSHADAVQNTKILFAAAKAAGVERIVHVSITNPSLASELEYFRGKAQLEQALMKSGTSYAILRPTVLFGQEDVLVNNIAWSLRRLPLFGVFGDGCYRLQPIYVEDLADLAVAQGERRVNAVIEAIGPETFTYRELVATIGAIIGRRRPIVSVPPALGYLVGAIMGRLVKDVVVTREEIEGLMADLLHVDAPPAGCTRLTDWAREHAATLGVNYTSELARRVDRESAYGSN
jgi:NADH dehydrogenase